MKYFIEKLISLRLLIGDKSDRLNLKLSNYILVDNGKVSIFDYQKVIIKLYQFIFLINNLVLCDNKFTISNFQKTRETNVLELYRFSSPDNEVLTTWYPGLLSNREQLESLTDFDNYNFLPVNKPTFLLNFGKLISKSLFTEVHGVPTVLLTTVNSSEVVNNQSYFLPLNSSKLRNLFFLYYFFINTLRKAQRTVSNYKTNQFLQNKYKLYEQAFVYKKKRLLFLRLFSKWEKRLRVNIKWRKFVQSQITKISKKRRKLASKLYSVYFLISYISDQKKILKKDQELVYGLGFHRLYYKYYYNPMLTHEYEYQDEEDEKEISEKNTREFQLRKLIFFKNLKAYEYEKMRRYVKTKHNNKKFRIPYRYFKYVKNRKQSLYLKFIFKLKFNKKKAKFSKIFKQRSPRYFRIKQIIRKQFEQERLRKTWQKQSKQLKTLQPPKGFRYKDTLQPPKAYTSSKGFRYKDRVYTRTPKLPSTQVT